MANQLLTTDMIADRALMRLSERLSFLKTIPKQYTGEIGGAKKIGDHIQIPVPQHAVIRHGRVMEPAPLISNMAEIKVQDQVGFDLSYTSSELALDIEEFERRYLSQQIADLAVSIEAATQALAFNAASFQIGTAASTFDSLTPALYAKKIIEDQGGTMADKKMLLNSTAQVSLIPSLQGLFNSQKQLNVQYEEGEMGRAAGFDWYSSSVAPVHVNGAGVNYLVNGANQTGDALIVDGGTGALTKGTVFTIANVIAVHPQTKETLGYPQQFVVRENYAGGAGSLQIYPAIATTGANRNVVVGPADNAALTTVAAAGTTFGQSLAYDPTAFAFATVPLPELNGQKNSRRTYEGISMRVVEGSSVFNDMNLTRFDIMWAFGALRPQLAVKIANTNAIDFNA